MILPIVTWPDPRLLETATRVSVFDSDLKTLAEDMLETMHHLGGVGLAAPQVGVPLRVIVFNFEEVKRIMVNPRVVHTSRRTTSMTEMCLSCPGVVRRIKRPKIARLEWDHVSHLIPAAETFRGLVARIALHEVDHLDGQVIADE